MEHSAQQTVNYIRMKEQVTFTDELTTGTQIMGASMPG
jgi:hypothetical protein